MDRLNGFQIVVSGNVCLVQFAKRPIAGFVKTRLIPVLGADAALGVHVKLLKKTVKVLQESGLGAVQLWWDRRWESQHFLTDIAGPLVQFEQQGEDLGERMQHAIETSLASHNKVLLVGSDCPVINRLYLQRAISLLDQYDTVLGPSDDGGYVLIGARRMHPNVLHEIAWGTNAVLSETRAKFNLHKLTCEQLPVLYDVDEYEDYLRWQGSGPK